jgi:hypothetical protein
LPRSRIVPASTLFFDKDIPSHVVLVVSSIVIPDLLLILVFMFEVFFGLVFLLTPIPRSSSS